MITLSGLWLPILASAVAVFFLSSLVHMVFKWHNSDYHGFANEDEVRMAVRKSSPAPGEYMLPYCSDHKTLQTPEVLQKFTDGPIAFVTVKSPGPPSMGKPLLLWFVYTAAIGLFVAYIASRTLPVGAEFARVVQLVSTVAFMTYVGGSIQNGIWMGKPWRSVSKDILDGLLYGLATGLVFAWLWPH
jgi:hypothetical protein